MKKKGGILHVSSSELKETKRVLRCDDEEAKKVLKEIYNLKELNPKNSEQGLGIFFDQITNAMEKMDCGAYHATRVLFIFQKYSEYMSSISFSEINNTKKALGDGGNVVDAADVLYLLKIFKDKQHIDPLFSMGEISLAKEKIGSTIGNTLKLLLTVQRFWTKDTPFPLSEIKTMKEIIGEDTEDYRESFKLALQKEKYKEGDISKKEWHDYLLTLHGKKILKPSQVVNLLRMTTDEKLVKPVEQNNNTTHNLVAGLEDMTVPQVVKPSKTISTNKTNTINSKQKSNKNSTKQKEKKTFQKTG